MNTLGGIRDCQTFATHSRKLKFRVNRKTSSKGGNQKLLEPTCANKPVTLRGGTEGAFYKAVLGLTKRQL